VKQISGKELAKILERQGWALLKKEKGTFYECH
jgi:predicted RNA binding protein YcfA (HicA-like mRNA interferase family)